MSEASGPTATVWFVIGTLLLLATVVVSLRVAAEHQRVVVTRWGRVVRVGGPGLVWRSPLVERALMVSLRPAHFELGVSTFTADGTSVHVRATGRVRVAEPVQALQAAPDPVSAAITETEDRLAREVAHLEVSQLPAAQEWLEASLAADVSASTARGGVEVEDIEVQDVEVRLTPDLAARLAAQPVAGGDG